MTTLLQRSTVCDEKISQIERNGQKFSPLELNISVIRKIPNSVLILLIKQHNTISISKVLSITWFWIYIF